MATYGYVNLGYNDTQFYVWLQSTEPATVQWFIDEMTTAFPESEFSVQECQQGYVYRAVCHQVFYPVSVKAWIGRELCRAGWEPLTGMVGLGDTMSFRKILD